MNRHPEYELTKSLPLSTLDIVRLFVEFVEEGELINAPRSTIIARYRRTIRKGLEALRLEEKTVTFQEAVRQSLEIREHRRPSTKADLNSYTNRMIQYGPWENRTLRGINAQDCRIMLSSLFGHSAHVMKKAHSILHSIFSYGKRFGWCDHNPAEAIITPPVTERRVKALTPRQIHAIEKVCEHPKGQPMKAAVFLMLWCGVRPTEVQRLKWHDIDAREKCVYVDPHVSKTGGARAIPLRGRALELIWDKPQHGNIAPSNWAKRWRELRRAAGFIKWQNDVLRHTFASYHLKCFQNLPLLQVEMGHRDSSLLRTRYVNMRGLRDRDAKRFFRPPESRPAQIPPTQHETDSNLRH